MRTLCFYHHGATTPAVHCNSLRSIRYTRSSLPSCVRSLHEPYTALTIGAFEQQESPLYVVAPQNVSGIHDTGSGCGLVFNIQKQEDIPVVRLTDRSVTILRNKTAVKAAVSRAESNDSLHDAKGQSTAANK